MINHPSAFGMLLSIAGSCRSWGGFKAVRKLLKLTVDFEASILQML